MRLIRLIFYLTILAFSGLVAYAYLGPLMGVDFTPESKEIRQEIILEK